MINTVEIDEEGTFFLWFCELIFNFDVATVVQNDMVGCQITWFYFIGLEFSATVDDGVQKEPYLKHELHT